MNGTSYTFFTSDNAKQAPSLVRVLQEAGQNVNQDLMNIAEDQTGSKTNRIYNKQPISTNNYQFYRKKPNKKKIIESIVFFSNLSTYSISSIISSTY
jgi:hypothetical protein